MPRFRACANYGCKAPAANAFLTRKGAFAGKDRRPARMGGGGENVSAIVARRAETRQGLGEAGLTSRSVVCCGSNLVAHA